MKKSDLISGRHVVELENGDKYLCLDGYFVNTRSWYDTDAKICKIFEIQKPYSLTDMLIFDRGLNLVWENKKLSDVERVILENIDKRYKYIARDSYDLLSLFGKDVIKGHGMWCGVNIKDFPFEHLFKMVQWEDSEPTLISDLLERGE